MLEDQTFLKVAATLLFGKSLYKQHSVCVHAQWLQSYLAIL